MVPSQEKLYHSDKQKQEVIIDPASGKMLLRKNLEYFNFQVFLWLQENPSPYIPAIERFYEKDGYLIVEEEYIAGQTLSDLMKKGLSKASAINIIEAVMDGVSYLHHAEPPIIIVI